MTNTEKNLEIAKMLGGVVVEWYPPNKDSQTTGLYIEFPGNKEAYWPEGKRYWGDYSLKFDRDANWQYKALEFIDSIKSEHFKYISEINSSHFSIVEENFKGPSRDIVLIDGPRLESTFEGLFQFSKLKL